MGAFAGPGFGPGVNRPVSGGIKPAPVGGVKAGVGGRRLLHTPSGVDVTVLIQPVMPVSVDVEVYYSR